MIRGGHARYGEDNTEGKNPHALKISNDKLYEITKTSTIESYIDKQFLKYTAHVTRMDNSSWQKQMLFMDNEVPHARSIWPSICTLMGGIEKSQALKVMSDKLKFGKVIDERFGTRKPKTRKRATSQRK